MVSTIILSPCCVYIYASKKRYHLAGVYFTCCDLAVPPTVCYSLSTELPRIIVYTPSIPAKKEKKKKKQNKGVVSLNPYLCVYRKKIWLAVSSFVLPWLEFRYACFFNWLILTFFVIDPCPMLFSAPGISLKLACYYLEYSIWRIHYTKLQWCFWFIPLLMLYSSLLVCVYMYVDYGVHMAQYRSMFRCLCAAVCNLPTNNSDASLSLMSLCCGMKPPASVVTHGNQWPWLAPLSLEWAKSGLIQSTTVLHMNDMR